MSNIHPYRRMGQTAKSFIPYFSHDFKHSYHQQHGMKNEKTANFATFNTVWIKLEQSLIIK